jgi:hypothetical protein
VQKLASPIKARFCSSYAQSALVSEFLNGDICTKLLKCNVPQCSRQSADRFMQIFPQLEESALLFGAGAEVPERKKRRRILTDDRFK